MPVHKPVHNPVHNFYFFKKIDTNYEGRAFDIRETRNLLSFYLA